MLDKRVSVLDSCERNTERGSDHSGELDHLVVLGIRVRDQRMIAQRHGIAMRRLAPNDRARDQETNLEGP